jgi:hypothetical protein
MTTRLSRSNFKLQEWAPVSVLVDATATYPSTDSRWKAAWELPGHKLSLAVEETANKMLEETRVLAAASVLIVALS